MSRTKIYYTIPIRFNSGIAYLGESSTTRLIVQGGKLGLISKKNFLSLLALYPIHNKTLWAHFPKYRLNLFMFSTFIATTYVKMPSVLTHPN